MLGVSSALNLFGLPSDIPTLGQLLIDAAPEISPSQAMNLAVLVLAVMLVTDTSPAWVVKKVSRLLGFARVPAVRLIGPTFHSQAVRISIAELQLNELVTPTGANEAIHLVLNADNYSGLALEITRIGGYMTIGKERQRPPTLEVSPVVFPDNPASRPIYIRQETPDLRQRMFAEGMHGQAIIGISLGNLTFSCVVKMPDGTTQETTISPSEAHFLLRGPFQTDEDYLAVVRPSIAYGSSNWYSADGFRGDRK